METPRFEYSRGALRQKAKFIANLKAPFGITAKYAVKANPHPQILHIFDKVGLGFDASSSYEAQHILENKIAGNKISLSSQQSAHNLQSLVAAGVSYIATSEKQIREYAALKSRPNTIGVRFNPGVGSGFNNRNTTAGVSSGFGIWHEYIPDVLAVCTELGLKINLLHTHIGTGTNPKTWGDVANIALGMVEQLPDVETLNLGGGFKTEYKPGETDADIESIIDRVGDQLEDFANDYGRKLKLEIEPGRFLVAHAGTLVATVDDIVDTGKDGFTFIRINTGMNDFLRTPMYGAYHKIEIINNEQEQSEYVVIGHNCESSDLFTSKYGDPEIIETRRLNKVSIGDEIRIFDTGAYCASMRARGYNHYPDAIEIMVD